MPDETTTIESPETTATAEATPESGAEQSTPAPDVSEQLQALNARLDTIAPLSPDEHDPNELFGLLSGEEDLGEGEYDEQPQGAGTDQPAADDEQQIEQAFQEAIRERVADEVSPYLEQLELERREGALAQLAQKYPDLRKPEMLAAIQGRLSHAADRYGNPALLTDPGLVEQALLAERAVAAAANETPAQEARAQGAAVETGAGAGGEGDVSWQEQQKRAILNAGPGSSVFR